MSNNQIQELKGLDRLKKLELLELRGNNILEIKGLSSLNNLRFIDLSQNQISELNGAKNLKYLTHLFLDDNKINSIKVGAFDGLERLFYLRISNNQLTTTTELLKINSENLGTISLDIGKFEKTEIEQLKNKYGKNTIQPA